MEPPLADGRLKTARKGVGRFTLEITGRAAHAGVEPEKGVSAVTELAHQILAVNALADPSAGTTVNVGVVRGGTTPERRPRLRRPPRSTSASRPSTRPAGSTPRCPRSARSSPASSLPRRAAGSTARRWSARRRSPRSSSASGPSAARSGLELGEGSTGGGSDGNFTAALGVPTLDGLGAPGAGAHAEHEHVVVDALPERAALLAALLLNFDQGS